MRSLCCVLLVVFVLFCVMNGLSALSLPGSSVCSAELQLGHQVDILGVAACQAVILQITSSDSNLLDNPGSL